MSASRPSRTARACFDEPPCDCWKVTALPVFACQCFAKAALKSWYSSRVGSYETLSRSCAPAGTARTAARARAAIIRNADMRNMDGSSRAERTARSQPGSHDPVMSTDLLGDIGNESLVTAHGPAPVVN